VKEGSPVTIQSTVVKNNHLIGGKRQCLEGTDKVLLEVLVEEWAEQEEGLEGECEVPDQGQALERSVYAPNVASLPRITRPVSPAIRYTAHSVAPPW
jgi:hypothetical protein